MKTFAICIFLSGFLTLPNSVYSQPQGDANNDLLNRPVELHLTKETLMLVLSTLSVEHRVPIGVEYSLADANESKISVDVAHNSLRNVLDLITKQEPAYRWEMVDGVINFIPTRERDSFIEELLNTRVAHFNPGKWTIIFEVRDAIGDTPEVKRLLDSQGKRLAKYSDYAYSPSIYTNKDVDLSTSSTTVRGILNKIIRDSEHREWSIGWQPGGRDVVSLRF